MQKFVLLGLESGLILIYSIEKAQLVLTLSGGHTNKVNDIKVINNTIYSAGSDGQIIAWDLLTGSLISKTKAQKSISKIAKSSNGKYLATADFDIKLWDLSSMKCIKTFTGHATLITELLFSMDDTIIVSSADQDRYVSIWNVKSGSTNVGYDPPVHISVNKNGQTLAIDELGKVFVFAMDIKDQIKPSSAISTITVLDDKSIVPILDAVFVDSERIDIVWGTRIKPMFETVLILDSNGNTIPIINLDRKVSFLLAKESFQTMSKTQDYKEADSIPDTFETLALAIKPVDSQVEAPKRPTAASLNVMLSQAIHSGDQTLLEKCLSQKDIKVVNLTVSRIPPSQAQPLLILLLDKLKKSPARLSSLIGWIKSVFHNHSAYLMSTPLLDRLSELYQVLDQRVSTNKKLSKLSGRLDLLASGIEKRGKTIEDDEDALIYNEEDDSEEEVDGEIADYEIEDEEQSENDSSEEEESSEESDDDDEDDEKMASGSDEE